MSAGRNRTAQGASHSPGGRRSLIGRLLVASVWLVVATLIFRHIDATAQSASRRGAAEKLGQGWPYPEPAQPGATGFSPDYSRFSGWSARWDIYTNLLWRKTASRSREESEYYEQELSSFRESLSPRDKAKLESAPQLPLIVKRIRSKMLAVPYREPVTGCTLFLVKHDNRLDLAADACADK